MIEPKDTLKIGDPFIKWVLYFFIRCSKNVINVLSSLISGIGLGLWAFFVFFTNFISFYFIFFVRLLVHLFIYLFIHLFIFLTETMD